MKKYSLILGGLFILFCMGGALDNASVLVQGVAGIALLYFVYRVVWGRKPKQRRPVQRHSSDVIDVYETTEVIRRKFIKRR